MGKKPAGENTEKAAGISMWPLFTCLSIPNIVGVIEAAVSSKQRIIFISHYPAMLTVATETIRHCIRVYKWSGLYVPVVHARHAKELVQEPGPYMLGITPECRTNDHWVGHQLVNVRTSGSLFITAAAKCRLSRWQIWILICYIEPNCSCGTKPPPLSNPSLLTAYLLTHERGVRLR